MSAIDLSSPLDDATAYQIRQNLEMLARPLVLLTPDVPPTIETPYSEPGRLAIVGDAPPYRVFRCEGKTGEGDKVPVRWVELVRVSDEMTEDEKERARLFSSATNPDGTMPLSRWPFSSCASSSVAYVNVGNTLDAVYDKYSVTASKAVLQTAGSGSVNVLLYPTWFPSTVNNAVFVKASIETLNAPSVTTLSDYACSACSYLTTAYLPNLSEVSYGCFESCPLLADVDISSATAIDDGAFFDCGLQEISGPLVTSIGEYAFCSCSSLLTADFPLVTSIAKYAFYGCGELISIDCPHVSTVGESAFYDTTELSEIFLPLATTIDANAFFESGIALAYLPSATTLQSGAFANCLSLEAVYLNMAYFAGITNVFTGSGSVDALMYVTAEHFASYSAGSYEVGNYTVVEWTSFPFLMA